MRLLPASTQSPQIPDVAPSNRAGDGGVRSARAERYRRRFFRVWGYIGIGIIVVAVCWCLGKIGDAISVLLAGGILAFIYAPITNALDKHLHVPRTLATFIGMITVFAAIGLLSFVIFPPIISQAASFVSALPGFLAQIQDLWNDFNEFLALNPDGQVQTFLASITESVGGQVSQLASSVASSTASGLFTGIKSVFSSFVTGFMAVVISFWLAKDYPRMEREVANIVGPRRGEDYRIVTSVFGRSLSGYLKGLIVTSTCTGVIAGLGFWVLGVPYAMLLGLLTAVLNVIPYIGPWVGGGLGFLDGLTVGPVPAVLSIAVTVLAQQFTDNLISPKVMQSAVSLHPVLVIAALSAGGSLGGILGMIAAVPLTAAIKGTFVYYFEKKTGRQLVSRDGSLFKGEPFCDKEGNPRPACDSLGVDVEGDKGVPERIKAAIQHGHTDVPDPVRAAQDAKEAQKAAEKAERARQREEKEAASTREKAEQRSRRSRRHHKDVPSQRGTDGFAPSRVSDGAPASTKPEPKDDHPEGR